MKRGMLSSVMAAAMLGMAGSNIEVTHRPHVYRGSSTPHQRKGAKRNIAGTKLQRKADAGVLTMRAPGGVVSQLCREIQQRKFNKGATK